MSECERALSCFCLSCFSAHRHIAHTHRGSSHESCVCRPCHSDVHEVSVSLRPCSPLLPHAPPAALLHLFLHLKLVDNLLRTPHKESMDLSDESYLGTDMTCSKMLPIKATTCLHVGPMSLDWPVHPFASSDFPRSSLPPEVPSGEQQQGAFLAVEFDSTVTRAGTLN